MTEKKSQFWPRGAKKHVNTAEMRRRKVILIKKCRTVLLSGTVTGANTLAQDAPNGFQGSPQGFQNYSKECQRDLGSA